MRVIIVIFMVNLLLGCSRNVFITGTYSGLSNPDYLMLKTDSTFIYRYNAFHSSEYSFGKWEVGNKKNVILNSVVQNESLPVTVSHSLKTIDKRDGLNLHFDTEIGLKNYKCVVFINDTLYKLKEDGSFGTTGMGVNDFAKELNIGDLYFRYVRCDSLLSFKVDVPIRSFFLRIIKLPIVFTTTELIKHPLNTEKYIVPSNYHGIFDVSVSFKDSLFNYRVFKAEKLKISKQGVSIFNPNKNTWWYIPKSSE